MDRIFELGNPYEPIPTYPIGNDSVQIGMKYYNSRNNAKKKSKK